MHRSDWYFFLMPLGCLALAALALSDSQYRDQERIAAAACATQNRCKRQQAESERAGLPRFAERFISNPEPDGVSETERRDLAAQEASAVWAFYALIIATIATAVTAVGTILLYHQIVLTRKAVEDTAEATEAMREGNNIARTSAERQLRAYITTEDHQISGFYRAGPTTLGLKIYNRGQTPAHDVRVWSIVSGTLGEPEQLKIFQRGSFAKSQSVIGPGQWLLHTNDCQSPLNNNAYIAIVAGDLKLVFAGVIQYRDIFGRRRFTVFKQFFTGNGRWDQVASDLWACGNGNFSS